MGKELLRNWYTTFMVLQIVLSLFLEFHNIRKNISCIKSFV